MANRRFSRSLHKTSATPKREDIRIEYPSKGATYCHLEYGVYKYDRYPSHSVLAGQQRRTFLGSFNSLEDAKKVYPDASSAGCGYQPPYLGHLSDDSDY